MNKSILMLGAAAMVMASCSNDETVALTQSDAIGFRAATSRATETTTANLTAFTVTALNDNGANFFTDVNFAKEADGFFLSSPLYYWPANGNLNFYAYAPAVDGVTVTAATKEIADFAPAATFAEQVDLVTATATGSKTNETTGVALTFNHQLAQIEVMAKSASEAYKYEVKGVKIANPAAKGTLDLGTSTWTLAEKKAVYSVEATEGTELTAEAVSLMGEGGNAMLLPQTLTPWDAATDKANENQGAYLAVLVKITTADNAAVYPLPAEGAAQGYAWAAVAIDTQWEAGKKYVYTIDFTKGAGKVDPGQEPTPEPWEPGDDILGSPIKFTVTVTDWVDASVDPIEMK